MLTPEQALKKYYGYDAFRPQQRDVIDTILAGQDCLVLMPTGGGKSVCYQIPAVLSEGTCIVVSPLIALMKDQVEALKRNQIEADYINSSQLASEAQAVEARLLSGTLKLLYVSPEKLLTQSFMRLLQEAKISFFAIDEAHCISGWGHDFRPEYTKLNLLKKAYPQTPIIALTATADVLTRQDISKQLAMENAKMFLASFDRPNIRINVTQGTERIKKIIQFLSIKSKTKQAGIIYCLSRKSTESIADKLKSNGYKAEAYHAGLDANQRAKVQEAFLKDEIQIICATIAFRMGIDKPNVRFVIHYNLPRNIESYYQEIGRAGRDGLESEALLFYSYSDIITWTEMIRDNAPNQEQTTLKIKKLERMQQFTEAQICRRKILLGYFHEDLTQDCGNCDVCLSPPQTFDGTLLAQKALSAHIRLKTEKNHVAGMGMLIDVLRGSQNQTILQHKFNEIKTFGAGKDVSVNDWRDYLIQMLNMGIFEIAYNENYVLRPSFLSEMVLKGQRKIILAKAVGEEAKKQEREIKARELKPKSKTELLEEDLLETLKNLRKAMADGENVAPHLIFGDATLVDMTTKRPITEAEFRQVSGVSEGKMKYAEEFLETIITILLKHYRAGYLTIKNATYLATLDLYRQGIDLPANIAKKRTEREKTTSPLTIEGHLIWLYERGFDIRREDYINEAELQYLVKFFKGNPTLSLSEIHDALHGNYDYFKIRWAQSEYFKLYGKPV
ncbi:MAG: DNA helicase RecQ [Bacteroidetes bacterium]|nr:MAG: DNA helicase RecQ [Bacteroidota bacterium]